MTRHRTSTGRLWRPTRSGLLAGVVAVWLATSASMTGQEARASLAGQVVEANQPDQPIVRAIVTVSHVESTVRISTVTDELGRFDFARLRPGRYMVSALKAPYVTATLGASLPGRAGTALALTAGQHLSDVRLALVRGAVLTGTVTDVAGMPAANHLVTAAASEIATGIAPVMIGAAVATDIQAVLRTVTTDDRGVFRVHGLPPGEYVIAVTSASPGAGFLPPLLFDPVWTRRAYGPVFYPGTPSADDASRVRVSAGEERAGLDLVFEPMRTAAVEGAVFLPDGTPAEGARVSYNAIGPPLPSGMAVRGGAPVAPDGSFRLPAVTPGRYMLSAGVERPGPTFLWATTELNMGTADTTGVRLTLQPPMSLSGRIVFEGAAQTLPPVRLTLRRPPSGRGPFVGGPLAVSAPDGSFTIDGIPPGRFSLTASAPTSFSGWWLKSAVAGGRDLLDIPLDFGNSVHDIKDVVLTLTDRATELTGRLQTAAGQPAREYFVIVFSANRAHWFPGARRTRAVRPASDGAFSVTELPAGPYLVAAVTDAVTDEWQRPSFLEQLAPLSVPVTVPDVGTVRQDLQIAR